MPLVTQNEYCNIHGQNPAWGSRLRAKDRLKLVEDPTGMIDPKTKKVRILVDSDATDLMNGFAELVITKQTPNSEATKKDPAPLPSNKTLENTTLLEAQRAKTFYEAETRKFELEVKKGDYILKSDMVKEAFELGREIREKMRAIPKGGLALKLSRINDPHEIEQLLLAAIDKALTNVDI